MSNILCIANTIFIDDSLLMLGKLFMSDTLFTSDILCPIHSLCPILYVQWDRGGAVVKVLCYKSEVRCFDPSWCHWNFSLT